MVLLDTRPEEVLKNQGVVELKQKALGKGAWIPKVIIEGKLRKSFRSAQDVEWQAMA